MKVLDQSKYLIKLSDYCDLDIVPSSIAVGSSGIIYKISKTNQDNEKTHYAVKVLQNKNTKDEINTYREIQILMKFQHPTIIKFYGYSNTDFDNHKNTTIVMDYAENGSLFDTLNDYRNGKLDESTIFNNTTKQIILIGIARGMMHLHQHNAKHRDLKPGNILLDKNYYPHLADFGLSKEFINGDSMNNSTSDTTALYMAPEMKTSCKYNRKADVYAFGLIMLEIIAGFDPTSKNDDFSINSYMSRKKIKESFKSLISQCCDDDPNKRPTFEVIFKKLAYDFEDPCIKSNYFENSNNFINDSNENPNYFLDDVDFEKVFGYLQLIDDDMNSNMYTKIFIEKLNKLNKENEKMKKKIKNLKLQIKDNNNAEIINKFERILEREKNKNQKKLNEIELKISNQTKYFEAEFKRFTNEKLEMSKTINDLENKIIELSANKKEPPKSANNDDMKIQSPSKKEKHPDIKLDKSINENNNISDLANKITISEFNQISGSLQNKIFELISRNNRVHQKLFQPTKIFLNFVEKIALNKTSNNNNDDDDDDDEEIIEPFIKILTKKTSQKLKEFIENIESSIEFNVLPQTTNLLFTLSETQNGIFLEEYENITKSLNSISFKYDSKTSKMIFESIKSIKEKQIESNSENNITTTMIIPSNIKNIKQREFFGSEFIDYVVFDRLIENIYESAFNSCQNLKEIVIKCSKIGDRSFYNCESLKKVILTNSVNSIGKESFYYCTSLKKINIPASVTEIGSGAFSNCILLSSVKFENHSNLHKIGMKVFKATNITEISIPVSVEEIGKNVFSDCNNLEKVEVHSSLNLENDLGISKEKIKILDS